MKKKNFDIRGAFCFLCLGTIVDVVRVLDGVKSVQVGFGKATTLVEFDSAKISVDRIQTAIERAGFSVAAIA
jgi:copper chaperone CopZ